MEELHDFLLRKLREKCDKEYDTRKELLGAATPIPRSAPPVRSAHPTPLPLPLLPLQMQVSSTTPRCVRRRSAGAARSKVPPRRPPLSTN